MTDKPIEETALPALAEGMNRMANALRRLLGDPPLPAKRSAIDMYFEETGEHSTKYDNYILNRNDQNGDF